MKRTITDLMQFGKNKGKAGGETMRNIRVTIQGNNFFYYREYQKF